MSKVSKMSKPLGTTDVESLDKIILKCPKCPKCPQKNYFFWFSEPLFRVFGQNHLKNLTKFKQTIQKIKNKPIYHQNLDKLDKMTFIWTKFLKVSNVVISTFLSTFGQIGQNGQHI